MADNIFEVLVSEQPQLAAVLNTNEDISSFLYAAYCHILAIAQETSKDPKDLMCLVAIENGRLLKISLKYYENSEGTKASNDKSSIKRNFNLVSLLKVNHNIRTLAERVVEILERWVNSHPATKAQGFKSIKCTNSMLWRGSNTITSELKCKFEFDEYVKAKMNWDMDEDESLVEENAQ